MTHLDTGNYAAKHQDRTLPEELKEKILAVAGEGRISCQQAHRLAAENRLSPAEIGRAIDLLEIRLTGCQLGLFDTSLDRKPIAPEPPDEKLRPAIEAALVDGRLPCAAAWELADRFQLKKRDITAACEYLKIRIKPCQLGAF